jgi:hypothetical protein
MASSEYPVHNGRWIMLWQMMVPSVNKPSKSVPRPFIDSHVHGFIWTEIDLLCKCYCNHRTDIRFPYGDAIGNEIQTEFSLQWISDHVLDLFLSKRN